MPRDRAHHNTNGPGPTIDDFSLLWQPGHLLRRSQQRAVDLFVEEVGEDGPTPRQFAILLGVHQNPGINQTDLVRLTGIDRSTLTEMLRRLDRRGLIRRERMKSDQRTNALALTPDGEVMLRRALPGVIRAQERILAPISAEYRATLMEALELLGRADGEAR